MFFWKAQNSWCLLDRLGRLGLVRVGGGLFFFFLLMILVPHLVEVFQIPYIYRYMYRGHVSFMYVEHCIFGGDDEFPSIPLRIGFNQTTKP